MLDAVLDDERLNSLPLAEQALYFRLLATLNRQRSRDGWGRLDRFSACALAKMERWPYALQPYLTLASLGLVSLRCGCGEPRVSLRCACGTDSGAVSYLITKWPIIQGFTPAELRRDSGETPPLRGEKRRGDKKPRKSRPAADPASPEFKFATDFLAALVRVNPGFKPPGEAAFAKWVDSARLLIAERTEYVARDLARWLFDEKAENPDAAWWRGVILSLPKFREKYDQLAAKRRVGGSNARPAAAQGKSTSDLAERARAIVRTQRLALVGAAADADG